MQASNHLPDGFFGVLAGNSKSNISLETALCSIQLKLTRHAAEENNKT